MLRRLLVVIAVSAAVLAALLAALGLRAEPTATFSRGQLSGKNNTVLFLTDSLYGVSNVHLATAQALIERHTSVQVHFASFPKMAARIARVASLARTRSPSSTNITFHELRGQSFTDAIVQKAIADNLSLSLYQHPPGLQAYPGFGGMHSTLISPWQGEAHLSLHQEVQELISNLDPAVVVLEVNFRPAIDATRDANRRHVFIDPASLSETLAFGQPYGKGFWKYPRIGSDLPFPVPWRRIPENLYLTGRFLYTVAIEPRWRQSTSFLTKHGISTATPLRDGKAPWIAPNIPGATLPLDIIPKNIVPTNAIVLESATAAQQDPELTSWLKRAPTVLINMGSVYLYTQDSASSMAQAIQILLAQKEVQVLWKLSPQHELGDDFRAPLETYITEDRVRIMTWLPIDSMAMFETGHIVASVHHGGANSYFEAITGGIPQVITPMWFDLYNYAQLAEDAGVGIYATRGTAPDWSVEGLSNAFLGVWDGPNSARIREKAQSIARLMRKEPGSHQAAKFIANLATHDSAST